MDAMGPADVAGEVVLPSVRVDVLGPLKLIVGDEVVEVPGPKRRALLALLAMADSRAVPTGDLFDAHRQDSSRRSDDQAGRTQPGRDRNVGLRDGPHAPLICDV